MKTFFEKHSDIYEYLKSIVLSNKLTKKQKFLLKESKKKLDYSHIDYSKSDTFFTKAFEQKLNEIIRDPEEFKYLNRKDVKQMQTDLDQLSQSEYEWKLYDKKICREDRYEETLNQFQIEFEIFDLDMKKYSKIVGRQCCKPNLFLIS